MTDHNTVGPIEGGGGDLLVRGDRALALEPGTTRVTVMHPKPRKRGRNKNDVTVRRDTPLTGQLELPF